MAIRTETLMITPAMAAEFLKKNTVNRKIDERRQATYARDMRAGNWRLTHQGICFDSNGNLSDGQHRLRACVVSGKSFKTLVTYGVNKENFKYIDAGKNRSMSDAFYIQGYSFHTEFPALCLKAIRWGDGQGLTRWNCPVDDVLSFAEGNRVEMEDIFKELRRKEYKNSFFPLNIAYFLRWLFREEKDRYIINTYLLPMLTGRTMDSYIVKLRNELINETIRHRRISAEVLLMKFLHATVCSIKGKNMREPLYEVKISYDYVAQIKQLIRATL